MFSWLGKVCSSNNNCPYSKALENCTYADWSAPSQSYMQYVIECIQGKHIDVVRVQKAFLIFRTKFEKHEDKNNPAFRLKNLLILDRCTEQKCILDMIANYEYNRLFYDRNRTESSLENRSIQQFVCSYYMYIKKKADIYQKFPDQLLDSKTRKQYLNHANNLSRIFQFIDLSLQIQKTLTQANEPLKKVNKSPLLIQEILTCMLKSYIFLYTIVAISLQTLLGKLKSLRFTELNNLQRLLKYFSREFTNTFLNFVQANKTIPAFKNIQYNQIIKIDQNYLSIFEKYYKIKLTEQTSSSMEKSTMATPKTINQSVIDSQEFQTTVQQLPEEVYAKLTQELKFKHQPRKIINQVQSSDDQIYINSFSDFQNYYSQDFIREHDSNLRETVNPELKQSTMIKKRSSRIEKKKSIMQDLINSKLLKKKSMKQNLETKSFKENKWITFQNIYCEA